VVEDSADYATYLALLLQLQGHAVEIAEDGFAGITLAERFHPEIILLDLGLPVLNGFEVCRRIRSMSWAGAVVIVAHTGWGQAQDSVRTIEAGFDAHLTKPLEPEMIQALAAGYYHPCAY
jgi:DNA-binding response OmpR family regulator